MSNLFKSGIVGQGSLVSEPLVLDVNARAMEKIKANARIIRPVEEKKEAAGEEQEEASESPDITLDEAMEMAKSIREEASERANAIIQSANDEADAIRENARKSGYETGLEEGNLEAAKRADVYLANIQKEQDEFVSRTQTEYDERLGQSQESLIDLSCQLVAKLTGILVDEYRPVMVYMINQALSGSDNGKNIIIKVPEESYAYISDNRDRIVGAANPSINIDIFADSNLTKRQCMIETDNGIIDLSMDVQVNNLITAVKLLS
ncbi:MAG: FliH/SctL family protein [Clostridium sp.]|nr:FliH/SctL family protein [Clostridium sp.]MCM1398010.1 FliH/SctL family protein [Clostridium sp.]MCM1459354.1 FliH/SctL family protein [Bacteroides sp.]